MVKDGQEALDMLRDPGEHFDLLFTDNQMPRKTGLEVLTEIREGNDERLKEIPAILMSGTLTPQIEAKLEELNVQAIAKPARPDKIKEAVKKALEPQTPEKTPETPTE